MVTRLLALYKCTLYSTRRENEALNIIAISWLKFDKRFGYHTVSKYWNALYIDTAHVSISSESNLLKEITCIIQNILSSSSSRHWYKPFTIPLRLELLHNVKEVVVNVRLIPKLSFNLVQIPERIINLAINFVSPTSFQIITFCDIIQRGVKIDFHGATLVKTFKESNSPPNHRLSY